MKKMNFSEMKEQVINSVTRYFNRDWNRDDMMNSDEIPDEVHTTLQMVYLCLFCTMLSSTFGTYLQWLSIAGGKHTVLSYVANLILLYLTPPERLNTRILISMLVAYSFGSSFGFFVSYLFKIEQSYVLRLWAGITIGIGNFFYRAITTTDRSEIYIGCLQYCIILMISGIAFILWERHTALWMITIHTLQILFMGYLVIYSQEILYDANYGDINFVNCTLTVFFHLPGIVIHAARLYLQGVEIEQHEQN
ncbi:bax inhibitor 1-like [Solanum dulcamara]|uniref:bax inhibitor 1-like n=1 Tax=Solanum dulcamara TaxID=45834 RepID=UPI002486382F|nr:bax inhibitor 1-like [Solanum dulcamara]